MTVKTVNKLIDEYERILDELSIEHLTVWNIFTRINSIASNYENVDCFIHINFANGSATQGMCILTDWEPVALALQSDDGDVPKLRIICPEEFVSFMEEMDSILEVEYPVFPEEQDS